jgi:uncharacterized protein YdeI (BOF family)
MSGKVVALSKGETQIRAEVLAVKNFLLRLSLAAALTFLSMALGQSLHGQQADQDPAPATPHQPEAQQAQEAQMPASGEATTHEAKTFSGNIVKENGELVLRDPITKVSYKLSDVAKAKRFIGKRVKVTGKLDMDSNTIEIESIELIS